MYMVYKHIVAAEVAVCYMLILDNLHVTFLAS